MPAAFTESAWRAYPHYGQSSTAHTEEDRSHDGRSVWKMLGKSFLLQGWLRASLNESSTHSTLTLSPYFEATAGGEGSGSINPLVIDQLMLILTKDISEQDEAIDIIMHQRREQNEQIEGGQDGFSNSNTPSQTIVSPITSLSCLFCFMTLPASFLYFKPLLSDISMAVRKVKACISESSSPFVASSPKCRRSSHFCWSTRTPVMFAVRRLSRRFQERSSNTDCQNENECVRNNLKGSLHMQTRTCCFSLFQEVKIQEMVFALIIFFV